MLSKSEFIDYVLGLRTAAPAAAASATSALPGDLDDFEDFDTSAAVQADPGDFARGLLERCFGDAPVRPIGEILVPRDDADQQRLDSEYEPGAHYWRKTESRPFHVVLVRLKRPGSAVLSGSARRTVKELKLLEDELHRRLQDGLVWFERGGPRRTTEMPQGSQSETLYVVAITDDRTADVPRQLVCFGTRATATAALEAFVLREEVLDWDAALAREHLDAFFARHLEPLGKGARWQDAFVTGEERKKAKKLMEACCTLLPDSKLLLSAVRELLDEIAGNFGLRRKRGKGEHRLTLHTLPENHSIAADPTEARTKKNFRNPFQGVRVFDASERLLGYIIYVVDGKKSATKLAEQLQEHNHFHNVLVVYPDQQDAKLELWQGSLPLQGSLRGDKRASQFNGEGGVVQLLSRFFVVGRTEIDDSKRLAYELAWRAQHLKALALDELRKEKRQPADERPLRDLLEIFNKALATLDEEQFADAYAQTITYGLLAARWMSAEREDLPFTRKHVEDLLPSTSPFLHDLFARLLNSNFDVNLAWLLDDVTSLLGRTTVSRIRFGKNDPSIHFYEDFLDQYDKNIRAERGVYYTPDEVVSYIVRTSHSALQERFGLRLGLADTTSWGEFAQARGIAVPEGVDQGEPFVQILDPACGTGTFPLRVIEVIHETMTAEFARRGLVAAKAREAWVTYVRKHLLPRLNAFELMMAPYIVTHLRLGLALQQTGFKFEGQDRLRVFLTNTLEMHTAPQLSLIGEHVAAEAREAERVKKDAPISVIVGNPPYERLAAKTDTTAEWILKGKVPGRESTKSLFDDIYDVARTHTIFSHHASLYDRYVYFWRWALWKAFEHPQRPGMVHLITNGTWLSGPGFVGLRQLARQIGDEIWTVDLGGDNKCANPEPNVFNIETPVAIAAVVRTNLIPTSNVAAARYRKINGSREEKLSMVKALHQGDRSLTSDWAQPTAGAMDSLVPPTGGAAWLAMPALAGIFPWQQPGCKFGRLWPIAPSLSVLTTRWKKFVSAKLEERPALFYTSTSGRNIHTKVVGLPRLADLGPRDKHQPIVRYGYRSFDRQWAFSDPRMAKTESPSLWVIWSAQQVFLVAPMTKETSGGPCLVVTVCIPDLDHFRGSFGGKDVIPLYRDADAKQPNITHGLLAELGKALAVRAPTPEDLAAYVYALLSALRYQERFSEALKTPGPRVPMTRDAGLWKKAVALGKRLLWLHTYAERMRDPAQGRGDRLPAVPGLRWTAPVTQMPEKPSNIKYDASTQILTVGNGTVAGVRPDVWDYSVSGMQVVAKWLGYRTAKGAGKSASSTNPLDQIRLTTWPEEWSNELIELLTVLTITMDLQPEQAALLDAICDGPLIPASELPQPTEAERKEPKVERKRQGSLV